MSEIITVGLDLAKNVFQARGADGAGYRDVRRRDINRLLDGNDGKIGCVNFADIQARHIQADRNRLSQHPANERLKTWRALCAFALEHLCLRARLSRVNPNPERTDEFYRVQ